MRRWLIRILIVVLAAVALGSGGLVLYIRKNYSPENIRLELESTLSRKTGLGVTVENLDFTWLGDIRLKKICLKNPQIRADRCLLSANIVKLDLRMLPLLRKKVEIRAAHLEDLALNLFAEAQSDKSGKKVSVKSWEFPPVADASPSVTASRMNLSLDDVKVSGSIFHEAPLLPLPQGVTHFTLQFKEGESKKISAKIIFPDQGQADVSLGLRAGNILQTAKLFLKERRLPEGDTFSGEILCQKVNLTAVDPRAGSVSGIVIVQNTANKIFLEAQAAELGILRPVNGFFSWSGNLAVLLPALTLSEGKGNLSTTGLTLAYSNLSESPTGINLDFELVADAEKSRRPLRLPDSLSGVVQVKGQIKNKILSGILQMNNFNYTSASGVALKSARFSGHLANTTLSMDKQSFSLNTSPVTVTASVGFGGGKPVVSGMLAFGQLKLDDFVQTSASGKAHESAPATNTPAAVPSASVNLKVTAQGIAYKKWQAANFSGVLTVSDGQMKVENAAFSLARGRMNISYTRNLATADQKLKLQAVGVKAQDLSAAAEIKSAVYGDISADASLQFSGSTAEAIRKTLTGTLNVSVGRGKIKDSFFQKGVLTGPLHKLEEKFADIEFASAIAGLSFSAGAMQAKKIFFDAEEWDVTLRAESDAAWNGKAALDFRFRSSFVENVANPLHMGIEGRKTGDGYDLPFACRGNILTGSCYKPNW